MEFSRALEEATPWILGVGAVLGLIGIEYSYFTNASEVRLLFVVILAPVGVLVGGLAAGIIVYGAIALVQMSLVIAVVGGVLALLIGIIYLLYSVVVWTN